MRQKNIMNIEIHTPITEEVAAGLQIGDTVTITGCILYGSRNGKRGQNK